MLTIKVGAALLFVLSSSLATASNVAQLRAGSLCEREEKIVFSCAVGKQAKIVSLCSSKELTKDKGYMKYRFGLPGKIELEYPKAQKPARDAFKYTHYFRAQVDYTTISFTLNGYEYMVSDDYNGEEKPVHYAQELTITPPGGRKWFLNVVAAQKLSTAICPKRFLTTRIFPGVDRTERGSASQHLLLVCQFQNATRRYRGRRCLWRVSNI